MAKRYWMTMLFVALLTAPAATCLAQGAATAPVPVGTQVGAAADQQAPQPAVQPPPESGPATGNNPPKSLFDQPQFFIIIAAVLFMFWWMGRSGRKREAARKQMLAKLQKGDKITTIGGVRGTVIEVREDEVIVKVDESNNVRMRFSRWAIRDIGEEQPQQKK